MGHARGFLSAAVVNDTIYAIGGSFRNTTDIVEAYNAATDTWIRKANMLEPRFGAAAGVIDGIIYNVGGNHTERNCEAYNPATDKWTRKTDIPETYGGIIVAPYGGLLYAIGGGFNEVFQTVYAYDPTTDGWTKKADMPTARGWSHPAPVVDGKIYVIGGYKTVYGEVLSDVEVYDPVLNSWTKLPDAPFKLALFGAAVVNGKIYIMGGTSDWSTLNGAVWEYDPEYVVPVELTSFTASANGKEVTLSWTTATELNNQGFEVQRKFGSNDFVTIGSVKGYGTTTSPNNYTYIDKLTDAGKYFYRLKQIDYGGTFEYSNEIEVEVRIINKFTLEQNYPNPFNPSTKINWQSPVGSYQTLKVYDVLGNKVATLVDEYRPAGNHEVEFDASSLASGIYLYQLRTGEIILTKKMVLIR